MLIELATLWWVDLHCRTSQLNQPDSCHHSKSVLPILEAVSIMRTWLVSVAQHAAISTFWQTRVQMVTWPTDRVCPACPTATHWSRCKSSALKIKVHGATIQFHHPNARVLPEILQRLINMSKSSNILECQQNQKSVRNQWPWDLQPNLISNLTLCVTLPRI